MTKLPEIYGDTALVTGASSGFGREFARELAREGFKNVVVVARREERLRELAKELGDKYGTNVVVIPQDLSQPSAVNRVVERVREEELEVAVLVNNVGVVTYGWFETIDMGKELAMIDINCKVPVELAHHYVPHMKRKGHGGIINMSGLLQNVKAGTFSTYCATKAFNAAFSECLNEELHGTGVDVICLNPGYHPDTEIMTAAGVPGSFPFPPGNPAALARHGLDALRKKRVMSVNGIFNKVLVQALKFMPIRVRQATNKILVGTPEKRFAANRA